MSTGPGNPPIWPVLKPLTWMTISRLTYTELIYCYVTFGWYVCGKSIPPVPTVHVSSHSFSREASSPDMNTTDGKTTSYEQIHFLWVKRILSLFLG